jgi:E3 ubiquitin-protein ligase RAD18
LRRNWAIQEAADAFQNVRPTALDLAKRGVLQGQENGRPKRSSKRKVADTDFEEDGPARRTRSSQRQQNGASQNPPSEATVIALDSEDGDDEEYKPEPEPNDGLVACPMCGKRMMEEAVYNHLDKCTGTEDPGRKPSFPTRSTATQNYSKITKPTPERLPQLNYTLLKDNALRKKLQELGIPNWGARQLLIKRHTEWVDIYNSNSDSLRPRSTRELLRDLDAWERSQGGLAQGSTVGTGVMKKDFDHEEWKGRHKDHFDDLIAAARAKRSGPEKESGEREERQGLGEAVKDPAVEIDGDSNYAFEIPETPPASQRPSSTAAMANGNTATDPKEPPTIPAPATVIFSEAASQIHEAEPSSSETLPLASRSSQNHTPTPFMLAAEPPKKMPMFAVPEEPIKDIDGGTEVK